MRRICLIILSVALLCTNLQTFVFADSSDIIKKISFVTTQEGKWQIYIMNQDGTARERLINQEKNQFGYSIVGSGASWSFDGEKIVFASNAFSLGLGIYTVDSDGKNLRQLTNFADSDSYNFSPTWSPDGKKIAFVSERDGDDEIYVMNFDGSEQTRLTLNQGQESSPAWSPDGSQIAFVSRREGRDQIYLMNPDGSNQRKLTNSQFFDENPSWSPDGNSIAFDRFSEIFVISRDGKEEKRVFSDSIGGFDPSWSPDGSSIAFTSNGIIRTEIFAINLLTKELSRITNNDFEDQQPNWQPYSAKELQVIMEGKRSAAELKAKQEAEAKAAAELKAKQEAEAAAKLAATKKTTITCVKGKLIKKVTAVKPVCPIGYKVKK